MGTSHTMPTREPGPPGSRLKSIAGPPASSPANRARVTTRAIKAGILTSSFTLGPDVTASIVHLQRTAKIGG